ncbi:MAG: type II secretion system protein GspC [Proteobacteria bacterium]|nr:type II secretion system protein GspC [Pseudomonadota bacterium]MYJ94683.1 type II secretion system protein GspC [Pseudomonadota bacterium]
MDDQERLQRARAAQERRLPRWRWYLSRQFVPGQRPPGNWAKLANRLLARAVSLGLVAALAYQLARITWALVPGASPDAPVPVVNPDSRAPLPESPEADIQSIIEAHLFGEYVEALPEPVAVDIAEAPETSLDLVLKATVSGVREHVVGAAVIASAGVERTYTVGEEIEGTGGALLQAIHSDRVILDLAGQLQTLRLPQSNAVQYGLGVVAAAPRPAVVVPTLRRTPSEHASRLRGIVQAVPHIEQGQVLGFRLNPADDPAAFDALGFVPGDVVTEINGTSLTEAVQAPEVFEGLGESAQANLVLIRDGAPRVLTIDTAPVEALDTGP